MRNLAKCKVKCNWEREKIAPRTEENGGGDVWYKELKHHNVYYIDHKTFLTRCVNIGDLTDKFLRFPLVWDIAVCWLLFTAVLG